MNENLRMAMIEYAKKGETVYYSVLAEKTGYLLKTEESARTFGIELGEVSVFENLNNRPLLSAIVVSLEGKMSLINESNIVNMPSGGFFGMARNECGKKFGHSPKEEEAFWHEQKQACFDYWAEQRENN